MCGIISAIAQRDVVPILLDGLKRLEYRGYDSAGIALLDDNKTISRIRKQGKVNELVKELNKDDFFGNIGISHTRWATHGVPSERNAHPHIVGDRIAVVHNGIIENYKELIEELHLCEGDLSSETDTEVAAHLFYQKVIEGYTLLEAVQETISKLKGAYALCVLDAQEPDRIIAVRKGSPLVVGVGIGEHFLASDPLALQKVAQDFIYLEEGDVVSVTTDDLSIYDIDGQLVQREIHTKNLNFDAVDKGEFRHYMLKEIFEQPKAIKATISGKYTEDKVLVESFGLNAQEIFTKTEHVQIVACGTSYHAGLVAKYWIEKLAKMPCNVEIASEFRYRDRATLPNTLFITISQSGETADTLAALKCVKKNERDFLSGILTICNVPESTLVRESDLVFLTEAGPEIGVATTKGFITQVSALLLLTLSLGRVKNKLSQECIQKILLELRNLPSLTKEFLTLADSIKSLASMFEDKNHALFLGRGINFPIAMEGALKLKEISYIHAEAYAAGELKHGPIALIDKDMPVIVMAPNDNLLDKVRSNIEEVSARGGLIIIFKEREEKGNLEIITRKENITTVNLPKTNEVLVPILYTIPLQLLSYYVGVLKGTDVDQPRNLAKSVTVE